MVATYKGMRLGKLPKKIDPRVPPLAKYLSTSLPPAPPVCDWTRGVENFGMLANDRLGDCTCAAIGHLFQILGLNASTEPVITDDEVIELYERACNYNPQDPNSDAGGIEVDVLNYVLKNGFAGHKIDGFTTIDPGNRTNIKDAIWLLGLVYIGLELPTSCESQDFWEIPSQGTTGDGAPGSLGGHAVIVVAYNAKGLCCVTWGGLKWMSWEFFGAYCSEAYSVLSKEWIRASGQAPSGFDYETLARDMAALGPDPISKIQEASPVDDPVLLDMKWHDVTISIHEASTTWVIGLLSTALAAYGQFDSSAVTTWLGTAGALFATWRYIARVHSTNISTKILVETAAEVIDILMRKRSH